MNNSVANIIAEKSAVELERDALKVKCAELDKALAQPGIDKDERVAIRKHCISVTNSIGDIDKRITALDARLPKVELPDERTWRQRARDSLVEKTSDPIVLSGSVVSASVWMWFIMRNYTFMRHHRGAYTEAQANWRQTVFLIHLPHVPGAVRIGAWAGLLAVVRSWTLPAPRGCHLATRSTG